MFKDIFIERSSRETERLYFNKYIFAFLLTIMLLYGIIRVWKYYLRSSKNRKERTGVVELLDDGLIERKKLNMNKKDLTFAKQCDIMITDVDIFMNSLS